MISPLLLFAQQTGSLKTIVTTSDGLPASSISVLIKEIKKGGTTNEKGESLINRIPAGNYTVVISAVGLSTQQKTVTIAAGQQGLIEVMLTENMNDLQEVSVQGRKDSKIINKESDFVARMPLKNLENPQVYNVVSSELMKQQLINNFDDAIKNVPGLDKLWSSTGRGGDGAGYFSLRGFAVQPTLVNGLAGLTNGGLDIANIERIEVLKGPSGTLFGSSLISYGGLINLVTKRPYETFGGEVSYTAGSFGLNRITVDVNTPLDKEKKVLLRINGAYHDENSFQDQGFRKNRFFAPSLTYNVNDKLTFLFNAEILSAEGTNPTMLFLDRGAKLKVDNIKDLGYNPRLSYTNNNLSIKNPVTNVQAQALYKLSSEWTSQTIVSRSTAKSDGYYSYLYEISQYVPGYPNIPSVFQRYITKLNSTTTTTNLQQNFNGDFNIAGMHNRVVIGLDYFNRVNIDNGTGYGVVGDVTIGGGDSGVLTVPNVDSILVATGGSVSNAQQRHYAAYISDVINITPNFLAMISARLSHFDNGLQDVASGKYTQTNISPKFGLVYQPIKDRVSIFGNYMNGFTNVDPRLDGGNRRVTFSPEQANQLEFGTKLNILDNNRIVATFSYYSINVSNVVRAIGGGPDLTYSQDGKNYSRGFEADVTANLAEGLNIIAGYSRNSSKVVQTDVADYLGKRPEGAGPQHLVNAWLSYFIPRGAAKGLGFGFGGNYASKNLILSRATTGDFALPAYTVLNASVSYAVKAFTVSVKVDNLTDKQYYKGWSTIEPMRTRAVLGNVTFRF
ncbi:TonB-dependent receptor [Mucilaginibacter hurinus]|uniref:TonB-dependent receptor n=1 Tax=Mucilaginibacter hurinus TaxID=2201324 RepID=UPI001F1B86A4|nr:TonB-dependent receptor [Mucilaginibacter hurinus]